MLRLFRAALTPGHHLLRAPSSFLLAPPAASISLVGCPLHSVRTFSTKATDTPAKKSRKRATADATGDDTLGPVKVKKAKAPSKAKAAKALASEQAYAPEKQAGKRVPKAVQQEVDVLRAIIKHADDLYYGSGDAKLKDSKYDEMYRQLQEYESTYPALMDGATPSPTVTPGAPAVLSDSTAAAHVLPMLSLQSCTSFDKIRKWDASLQKGLGLTSDQPLCYNLELKYDGIAVSLIYKAGRLVAAQTRGSGVIGEDITASVKRWVKNVPAQLRTGALTEANLSAYAGTVEVRGEILLTTTAHAEYTAHMKAAGASSDDDGSATPPRNLTAGLLRRDLDEHASATSGPPPPLAFVGYSLHFHHPDVRHVAPYLQAPEGTPSLPQPASLPATQAKALQLLADMGVPIALSVNADGSMITEPATISWPCLGVESVITTLQQWATKRDQLDFGIDGIVVKLDDLNMSHLLGATSHHPKGVLAYKFPAKTAETIVEGITWQVGREGKVVPVANLTPVSVDGVSIARASLHNCSIFVDLDLSVGDTVAIERRGDVIPYIAGKVSSPPNAKRIELPTHCPCSEHSKLVHRPSVGDPERFDLYCESPTCCTQQAGLIEHYCSKKALDIEGLGKRTVIELMDHNLVSSLEDLVDLPSKREVMLDMAARGDMPGWGPKRVDKICDNIENAHANASQEKLLIAVGIPRLGKAQAKVLIERFGTIEEMVEADEEAMLGLPGCGPKLIPQFLDAFASLKAGLLPHWQANGISGGSNGARSDQSKKPRAAVTAEDEDVSPPAAKSPRVKSAPREATPAASASGTLSSVFVDSVFCVSGTFSISQGAMKELITAHGGRVVDAPNKTCHFLVADRMGSTKTAKAEKSGIPVVTEAWVNQSIEQGAKCADFKHFLSGGPK